MLVTDLDFMHESALAGLVMAAIIVYADRCLVSTVQQGVEVCCRAIEELECK